MRLFLVVTLCAFVAIIEGAKPNPSFMRYVGSYSKNFACGLSVNKIV